jgi:type II secretory pathway pseudopilin PulG
MSETYSADTPTYSEYESSTYSSPYSTSYSSTSSSSAPSSVSSSSSSLSFGLIIGALILLLVMCVVAIVVATLAYTRTPSDEFTSLQRAELLALVAQSAQLTALNEAIDVETIDGKSIIVADGFTDEPTTSAGGEPFFAEGGLVRCSVLTASGNQSGDGVINCTTLNASTSLIVDANTPAATSIANGSLSFTSGGTTQTSLSHTTLEMEQSSGGFTTILQAVRLTLNHSHVPITMAVGTSIATVSSFTTESDITPSISSSIGSGDLLIRLDRLRVGSIILVRSGGTMNHGVGAVVTARVKHNLGSGIPSTWPELMNFNTGTPVTNPLSWSMEAALRVTAVAVTPTPSVTLQPIGSYFGANTAFSDWSFTAVTVNPSTSALNIAVTAQFDIASTISNGGFVMMLLP